MRRSVKDQRHNDQAIIDEKLRRLRRGESHTAPLVELVQEMRTAGGQGCIVPDVDPEFGGTNARALILLNHPIRTTSRRHRGSGLLSLDNADRTAANAYAAYAAVGLDRRYTLHWNASPWLDHDGSPLDVGVDTAIWYTARLIGLLHDLRIVALLGGEAKTFWPRLVAKRPQYVDTPVVSSWSPGPPGIDMPGRLEQFYEALSQVRDAIR